jgi:hypothetical protein
LLRNAGPLILTQLHFTSFNVASFGAHNPADRGTLERAVAARGLQRA